MKHLKEKCDIGDIDEIQKNTAARTPMKKKEGGVCGMYSNIGNEKLVEQIYVERAH